MLNKAQSRLSSIDSIERQVADNFGISVDSLLVSPGGQLPLADIANAFSMGNTDGVYHATAKLQLLADKDDDRQRRNCY